MLVSLDKITEQSHGPAPKNLHVYHQSEINWLRCQTDNYNGRLMDKHTPNFTKHEPFQGEDLTAEKPDIGFSRQNDSI